MNSDIVINVEVTISDALRKLIAAAVSGTQGRGTTAPASLAVGPASRQSMDWQDVVLRRDGQRPLMFTGVLVFCRRCPTDEGAAQGEQTLSLYLAQDQNLYASLVYLPAETTAARPVHRCRSITRSADLAHFLQDWHPEQCFDVAVLHGRKTPCDHAAVRVAVRSAFNTIIADWVQPDLLPE